MDGRESKFPHLEKNRVPQLEDERISFDAKMDQRIKIQSNEFAASKNDDIESDDKQIRIQTLDGNDPRLLFESI